MISEHSEFNEYRNEPQQQPQQQRLNETDRQRLNRINEINLAIKKEIKKVKKPFLLNKERMFVPNVKFYSANIPRKLYWTEISKVKSLKLLFARMGIASTATVVSAINVRRIAIIATAVLAILLLLGLASLLVIRGLNNDSGQGGPTIEVDKTGDISLTVYTNETEIKENGIVIVKNYNLDEINYTEIRERVLVRNTSATDPLYIMMYAEISLDEVNSNLDPNDLYVALNTVDSRLCFEEGNKGVLYTKDSINVGVAFDAFRGLGLCLYSGVETNPWASVTVHVKIKFKAYSNLDALKAEMASLSSAIYSVDNKDIKGNLISNTNPAVRSKLN